MRGTLLLILFLTSSIAFAGSITSPNMQGKVGSHNKITFQEVPVTCPEPHLLPPVTSIPANFVGPIPAGTIICQLTVPSKWTITSAKLLPTDSSYFQIDSNFNIIVGPVDAPVGTYYVHPQVTTTH